MSDLGFHASRRSTQAVHSGPTTFWLSARDKSPAPGARELTAPLWSWRLSLEASNLSVAHDPPTPTMGPTTRPLTTVNVPLIAALAVGVLAAANVLAFFPALLAARSRPAQLLRAE